MAAVPAFAGQNAATGESTAKTDEAPLTGNGGNGISDVRYRCAETLSAKGEISVKCDFTNKSKKTPKLFIVCMMLDLKKGKQKAVPGIKKQDKHNYVLEPDPNDPKVLKCKQTDTNGSGHGHDTSYHLGCHVISLKPGETKSFTWSGSAPFVSPPKVKVQANDFWINYADTINLEKLPNVTLDEKSCAPIIGQGQFLVPNVKDVSVNWVAVEAAFKDPVVGYQGTSLAAPTNLVYELLSVWPCAPPDLESTPPEGTCPRSPRSPPSTKVDLNLYWFDSLSASPHESYPAVLRVRGNTKRVRLVTDPPSGGMFRIPGGRSLYGSIRACSNAHRKVCIPPDVPEGTRTSFEVDVVDPNGGHTLFSEFGTFVQDTHPPHIDKIVVTPGVNGGFAVNAHAVDAATSPIAATLWYSIDNGTSWQAVGLEPTSNVLDPSHARTFTGTFAVPPGQNAKYYVVVQDELYNDDWYGPGTAARVAPPGNPTLTAITVSPADPAIFGTSSTQLTASGTYSDGSTENLTATVTWVSANRSVATISNAAGSQGVATGTGAGSTTISATSGSVTGATTLTVNCQHSGGLGNYSDCNNPLGTPGQQATYNPMMATEARDAWIVSPATTDMATCNGAIALVKATATEAAVWVYNGPAAGYGHLNTTQNTPTCPTGGPGDFTWN
jgi:hypothetical protein